MGMRLESLIALGLLLLFTILIAITVWFDASLGPWEGLIQLCLTLLSFPLGMMMMLAEPQYEPGLVFVILAMVANCYLWGYCIAWIVRRIRRSQPSN